MEGLFYKVHLNYKLLCLTFYPRVHRIGCYFYTYIVFLQQNTQVILGNVTTPKSITEQMDPTSNRSEVQNDQIASMQHTQLFSELELLIPQH